MLANRNESRDSSRDIRNAPVTLISGLPAVSNHVLALAALLAKAKTFERSTQLTRHIRLRAADASMWSLVHRFRWSF